MSSSVVEELDEIFKRIGNEGTVSIDDALEIEGLTGYTMERILLDARNNRAKKYVFSPSNMEVSFYTGKEKEYLILPSVWYCSCMSRYPSNIIKRRVCYHLLVYKLCESLGMISIYDADDEYFRIIMDELK
jgi:predicted nucleic acid-binding Zn finger protein